jgi:hypothetical protein
MNGDVKQIKTADNTAHFTKMYPNSEKWLS